MQCHNKKNLVKTFTEDEDQSTEYIGSHPLEVVRSLARLCSANYPYSATISYYDAIVVF